MAIDAGKHPILESLHNDFIPNNLFLPEASNMVIVMGPNMCGKSTHLQQVCLLIILAQIGCYIPARFASIRTVDRIFTRIGSGDNVEYNTSTFHLKDGLTRVPHYGLLLAGVVGLPTSVVETARDIIERITEKDSKRMTNNCEQLHSLQIAYRVAQRLICLKVFNQGCLGEDDITRVLLRLDQLDWNLNTIMLLRIVLIN